MIRQSRLVWPGDQPDKHIWANDLFKNSESCLYKVRESNRSHRSGLKLFMITYWNMITTATSLKPPCRRRAVEFCVTLRFQNSLRWRHNWRHRVSNHQPHHCLLSRLFRRRSKRTSKLRVTGLCVGNSPEAGEFPVQMTSNAENVSIWWHHHVQMTNTPEINREGDVLCVFWKELKSFHPFLCRHVSNIMTLNHRRKGYSRLHFGWYPMYRWK